MGMTMPSRTAEDQRLAWLLETLGQGLWEWDVQTGTIDFSRAWLTALGYNPDAVPHDVTFWETLIHPDDVDRVREAFQAHLEGQTESVRAKYRVRTVSGDWRWTHDQGKVVERSADGTPVRVVGTSTDISEAMRIEAESRENSRFVAVLFDTAPVGIVALGPDRVVRSWNKAAERIFGWSAAEVVGHALPILNPADEEAFQRDWQELLAGTSLLAMERPALRKDGGRLDTRLSTVPLFGPDGQLTEVLGLLENITEQKRLAAQLLQAQRLENIGRLAGAVAHDFNNLLTVINGYSEIVLGSVDSRDPLFESVKEIKSAGDRAATLTQQLLAFSRRQVMQAKVLSINDVLGDLESMLRRLIGDDIQLVLARDSRAGEVKADPGQVQQVIMNLAVNARDAMPRGGKLLIETANVELGAEIRRSQPDVTPGWYVLLSVTDTGTGMDEATLGRLFEPFFTTKEKGKGTGLGLSTAYGIVKQSGGHIWAESTLGQGTTFKVCLPRVTESDSGQRTEPAPAAVRGTETVLLVEDQAEVRQLALHALGMYGYRVLSAANGAEALAIARQEMSKIDLVLSDVVMPGMTGPDLAKAIAPIRPGVKVLLMSGYTDEASMPGGEMPPDLAYIQKPFTPDTLARKVRHVLDARPATGRILVVDDEAEIRKLLRQFLEHAGYQVAEASNGRQAVAEVDAGGVALVITDLVMPEKEGIETIREMRQHHRDVKIIAMSGAFGGRFLRTAEMLGAHATLSKPVRAEQLVGTVKEVLGV
jgi:two-component system, cell cycle sensor histidine kinase and response regulator CckA